MFNLEQAIADWRRKFKAEGLKISVVLDELESHLRDEVDALLQTGINEQQAFEAAVARIGDVQTLKGEFAREQRLKTAILVAAMGAYVLVTAVPVLFKLGSFADVTSGQQRWALAAVVVTVIGFFAGRFVGWLLPEVSKRVRLIITAVGILLLSVWLAMFYHHAMTRAEWDMSQLVVALLWAMSPIPLFSILIGMEEAATGRTNKTHV
jgi:hypothetical protein